MISAIAARLAGAIAAGLVAAVSVTAPAEAQEAKPWRHGILAPKSDAGFLLMAARRGFAEREGLKLELLEVRDDQIGLKALLAGEVDSYEGPGCHRGRHSRRRRQDHRLPLAGRAARPHGQARGRHGPGPQGQVDRGVLARPVFPICWRASPWRGSTCRPPTCCWRRSVATAIATRPWSGAWSTRRWCRTNICRCRPRGISRCCCRAATPGRAFCGSACSRPARCWPRAARTRSAI